MNWKRPLSAAFVAGLCLAGARLGALVLRPRTTHHSSTTPCGAMLYRTTSTTRTGVFDHQPKLVESESRLEVDGTPLETNVARFQCVVLKGTMTAMAVVLSTEAPNQVRIFDHSGVLSNVVKFEHDVESTSFSREGTAFAAVGRGGDVSVLPKLEMGAQPLTISPRLALSGTRAAWSPGGTTLCFVAGSRPDAGGGSAELWCAKVPSLATEISRAAWKGSGDTSPWVGFTPSTGNPHLCGDDLSPQDSECLGFARPE